MPRHNRSARVTLVIGMAGVGKSTLINMLFHEDASRDSVLGDHAPCAIGEGAGAMTRENTVLFNVENNRCFIDTVGFGDPGSDPAQMLRRVRDLLFRAKIGVHAIIVVMQHGRVNADAVAVLGIIQTLFEGGWQARSALVLTNYPEEEMPTTQEAARAIIEGPDFLDITRVDGRVTHLGPVPAVSSFVLEFGHFIVTDNNTNFPDDDEDGADFLHFRSSCLTQALEFVAAADTPIRARPLKLSEFLSSFLAFLSAQLAKATGIQRLLDSRTLQRMQAAIETLRGREDHHFDTYCGECLICISPVSMEHAVWPDCRHVFHDGCLTTARERDLRCPKCRQPSDDVFRLGEETEVF